MKCPHCGKDIPDDYGKEEEKSNYYLGVSASGLQLVPIIPHKIE